jgi:GH15 family glucan-1,4-alpha-glucosidase
MAITRGESITGRSLAVLRQGQAASGAFVASPAFRIYDYGWLRDGAFCAYACDVVGEQARSAAFHRWVGSTIEAHRPLAEAAIARVAHGEVPPSVAMLPARYTLGGAIEEVENDDPWPNFQIDGYGMWLWALEHHLQGASVSGELAATVELVAGYLAATWQLECWSCWEEFQGGEHTSTLAAAFAGLTAAARLLDDARWDAEAARIREALLGRFTVAGRFGRGPADARVDGSLAWLSVPFGVLPPDDPRIVATIETIKRDLIGPGGGVYRYLGDTYYGGGEWLLLTSSLAWHEAVAGDSGAAEELRRWVRAQATVGGDLPEQVTGHAQEPLMVESWVERWGPVANPLLWSHAMYLISEAAL